MDENNSLRTSDTAHLDMKIKSTNPATASFHDSDVMPDGYEVVFDEADGTVATVRKEVGEPLVESDDWPTIEAVDGGDGGDGGDGTSDADADDDSEEAEPEDSDSDSDDADADTTEDN